MTEHCAYYPTGLREAAETCGVPQERHVELAVSPGTMDYWQKILKKRHAEVIPLLERSPGRFLVHTKSFYPAGASDPSVYRLLSGGIRFDEPLLEAVRRETHEETNLDIEIVRFAGILRHTFRLAGDRAQGNWDPSDRLDFWSHLFWLRPTGGELRVNDPDESITGFRDASLDELLHLAEQLESLESGWADWGCFRACGHRFAVDLLRELL